MDRKGKRLKSKKPKSKKNFRQKLDKLTRKNRPKIPPLSQVNYWLNHPSTVDWLIRHWEMSLNWKLIVGQEESRSLAKTMLNQLTIQLPKNLNKDCRVHYRGLTNFDIGIGINVWNWTLWTSIFDLESDWHIISDKTDDLDLKRTVPREEELISDQ